MKPLWTILLMLLAAAVAAVITYLAVSNARLRESLAQREAAAEAARLAAERSADEASAKAAPQPWRPDRLTNNPPKPVASAAPAVAAQQPGDSAGLAPVPAPGRGGPTRWVAGGPPGLAVTALTRYLAQPGSKVRLEGTSSLHPWEVTGSVIGGTLEWSPVLPAPSPGWAEEGLIRATVRIPVRTLKSYQKQMDEVMQDTMEMSRFPNLDYELVRLDFRTNSAPNRAEFDATGTLTIHGVTLTNRMPVAIENLGGMARLKVTGMALLKMSDFGMKPVDVNLGIGHITTGDDVAVSFEWVVGNGR